MSTIQRFEPGEPYSVRLRGILTEYPPGISILMELLQNADDAGARSITYILDTTTYPNQTLIDNGLAEHQGPALLVYNDAVFTENDFNSLLRLGDSVKMQNKLATGKFGLGFNSVYGWTDTPCIISGKDFIALSPHERLDTPGKGIRDDFIAHSSKANIGDQLAAFSLVYTLVNTSQHKAFPGTIVRIPLRTKAQAMKSDIKNLAIKTQDVLKYFEEFQREVSESLTFLKNIETVSFYLNKTKLGSSSISNAVQIRWMRRTIASAITNNSACSFGAKFDISQDYASARIKPGPETYYVQQRVYDMRNLDMSAELKQWASDEKAVSWISLAAPLDISKPGVSHVFITLPLPIPLEKTRVNVHSLFAVKRDRRSLWTDHDSTGEVKMNEVLWNNLLVKHLMPFVWKDLLVGLRDLKPSVYDYFPLTTVGPLFDSLTGDVLQQILSTKSLIWRSTTGQYVPLEQGFLVEEHDQQLLTCLKQVSVPLLIGVPGIVVQLIRKSSYPHQILTPAGLRTWLRGKLLPSDINISTAMVLLEYTSSDEKMDQLYDLPLFARRNGSLTPLTKLTGNIPFNRKLYIGTAEESGLFDKNGDRFLSLESYSPNVAARIQSHISSMSASLNLEQFGIDGFQCYVQGVLFDSRFAKVKDVIDISACGVDLAWIQQLWKWLDTKPVVAVATAVQGSWLLPLEGQTLRKITQPSKPLLMSGESGLIADIYQLGKAPFPLVEKSFQSSPTGYLRANRQIVDATDLEAILHWITPDILSKANTSIKDRFRIHIILSIHQRQNALPEQHNDLISKLPIFKKLVPCDIAERYKIAYSSLTRSRCQSLSKVPCVPVLQSADFFDASSPSDCELLTMMGHPPLPTLTLLTDFVIPHLDSQPKWLIDPLVEFIFDKVPLAGKTDVINRLAKFPFVLVCDKKGAASGKRCKPSDVIDKTSPIARLYFDDESVFGSGAYSAGGVYHQNLTLLGMKCQFDADVAAERIATYATRNDTSLFEKCKDLVAFLNGNVKFKAEWFRSMRLPAVNGNQNLVLHPSRCRPKSFAPLVGGVLGIVPVHVEESLAKAFGWDDNIEPEIIGTRICLIAGYSPADSQHALYPVLNYLDKIPPDKIGEYVSNINSKLGTTPWLPGSTNKSLFPANRVFFANARQYEPYLSDIPPMWANKLSAVLKLFKVQMSPGPQMLVQYISSLDATAPLSDPDLGKVILALKGLENEKDPAVLQKLKLPDVHGVLVPIDGFGKSDTKSDPKDTKTRKKPVRNAKIDVPVIRYAHRRVPHSLAFKLNIPQFRNDLAHSQYLNGPDMFEEFTQEESIVKRIAGQVKQSTLWLSLNEFVANAEDCGSASKVTWALDSEQSKYPSKKLFCPELEDWQTPGIYVYNDGVFTDSDFEALVSIGMGSKSEDSSKIGKYGLGSLTMYLFTDVPAIISGEYFVMFDPQRQYLPFDHTRKRRKAGVRVKLSQMKTTYIDHLMPFVGIGGYTLDLTDYPGTIFRFPVRNIAQMKQSPFTWESATHGYESLKKHLDDDYLDQARRSLFMLKNIRRIDYQRKTFNYTALGLSSYQKTDELWSVIAEIDKTKVYKEKDDGRHFKNIECYTLNLTTNRRESKTKSEKCVVVKAFIRNETVLPQSLRQYAKDERLVATNSLSSVPDIAVAATITDEPKTGEAKAGERIKGEPKTKPLAVTKTLFYNSLPLESECQLPLNFHGRFAVSPDRRSLRTDSNGGGWNRFLAHECLPQLYYIFLEQLIIWHRRSIDPYKLWPFSSTMITNEITAGTAPAFWNQIRMTPRKLFVGTIKQEDPVHISQVLFDRRTNRPVDTTNIMKLVNRIQPSLVYVYKSNVINSLFAPDRVLPENALDLNSFTPTYIRSLLQQNSSEARMNEFAFNDGELKLLLEFILVTQDITELEGCRILRLQDGKLWKVQDGPRSCLPCANTTNARYFIDQEGFKIFKDIPSGWLITPRVLRWDLAIRITLTPTSNVQRFDGSVVDRLLRMNTPGSDLIETYSDEKSIWVSSVYMYVNSMGLPVSSFQTQPMIPVLKKNTFISQKGWTQLRIMPPFDDKGMRRVCDRLPDFHILANVDFPPLKAMVNMDYRNQFLQRLLQFSPGTLVQLHRERLDDQDLKYLKDLYVTYFSGITPTGAEIRVLQQLPLWKLRSGSRISAINVLLLPADDMLPADEQPAGNYVLGESKQARDLIVVLGGKMMDPEAYVSGCVFPYIVKILWSKSPKKDKHPKPKRVRRSSPEKSSQGPGCISILVGALIDSCLPKEKPKRPSQVDIKKAERPPPTVPDTQRQNVTVASLQTTHAAAVLPPISMVEPIPGPAPRVLSATPVVTAPSVLTNLSSQHKSSSPKERTRVTPEQTTDSQRPRQVNPAGLALLLKLLVFICKTPALLCSPFAGRPLVPNRNGELCRIADLYDPNEPIFAATFAGNNTKFPHQSVDTALLMKMGFNSTVTKSLFKICVEYLDAEYRTRGPAFTIPQRAVLYQRASAVWKQFNNRITHFHPGWTASEIHSLSNYHFVPVARFISTFESYRDSARSNASESLTKIEDLMDITEVPFLWTQKYRPATAPSLTLVALCSLKPTVLGVVKHLVDLTTVISSKCRIEEDGFYQDLIATYDWLEDRDKLPAAGLYLKHHFAGKAVWLNENMHLSRIAARGHGSVSRRIDSLNWFRSASLVDGIAYDAPMSNIFALKESLSNYKPLLVASGMNVVKRHVTETVREQFPDHPGTILGISLNEMRKSNSLCDMKIIVDGKTFFAHRTVLATFSSYFRSMLANGTWAETSTGILDLDDISQRTQRTNGNRDAKVEYATKRSVATVLDWIYKGGIAIDDDTHFNGNDSVSDRLDLYLEILQLTDVWDIPTLKTHIENRILRRTDVFIRVENVSAVGEIVKRYNAKEVAKHCTAFVEKNRAVVERIDGEDHS